MIRFYFNSIEQPESHLAMVSHIVPESRLLSRKWRLTSIKNYLRKRFVQRNTAAEFYLYDGSTFLLNFPNRDHESVFEKLASIRKRELLKNPSFGLKKKTKVTTFLKSIFGPLSDKIQNAIFGHTNVIIRIGNG